MSALANQENHPPESDSPSSDSQAKPHHYPAPHEIPPSPNISTCKGFPTAAANEKTTSFTRNLEAGMEKIFMPWLLMFPPPDQTLAPTSTFALDMSTHDAICKRPALIIDSRSPPSTMPLSEYAYCLTILCCIHLSTRIASELIFSNLEFQP
ncbi:hypothetical protein H5410_037781 [Solanum commersonii]|uniref:Uncharacterized protein n=1 Tax=Solanum commersonii TaxID=4109 RepID=A0A9J5Y8W4_SOLCO|nr:hypothetical protein H5410_037781 [Solanum commersonii]